MNTIVTLQNQFTKHLRELFNLSAEKAAQLTLELNLDESKQAFGDLTTNAAMVLAKELKKAPRDVAATIMTSFKHPLISRMEIAGPGFLNIFLPDAKISGTWQKNIVLMKHAFKLITFTHKHINIEFVSANPTGPLHFGHGRGGIIGDVSAIF